MAKICAQTLFDIMKMFPEPYYSLDEDDRICVLRALRAYCEGKEVECDYFLFHLCAMYIDDLCGNDEEAEDEEDTEDEEDKEDEEDTEYKELLKKYTAQDVIDVMKLVFHASKPVNPDD